MSSEYYADALRDPSADFYQQKPQNVIGVENQATLTYANRLFRRVMSVMEIKNIPDTWHADAIKRDLFTYGYLFIYNFPAYGILPARCSFYGESYDFLPTNVIITNPVLGEHECDINEGVLIKLQTDFQGAMPLVMRYAQRLANCDAAADISLFNSRMAYLIEAEDKQAAQSIKKSMDKVYSGEPFVVVRKDLMGKGINFLSQNVKQNFIANDVITAKISIVNEFLSEIGINNAPEKRERLNTAEVNVNNDAIVNAVYDWYLNIKMAEKDINKKFNLNIKFEFPFLRKDSNNDSTTVNQSTGSLANRSVIV